MTSNRQPLNRYFDHAILKSDTTEKQIRTACAESLEYHFFGLAVNPCWTELIASVLVDSDVTVVGVVGFPLGATTTHSKILEAEEATRSGAGEVDMVANIGQIVAGALGYVEKEICEVRRNLPQSVPLKVIIETPLLTTEQMQAATQVVINAGAQFVKTATGFFGETIGEALKTVVETNNGQIQVKASGGVKTLARAQEFITLGADRIGSSASVAIMREYDARLQSATAG